MKITTAPDNEMWEGASRCQLGVLPGEPNDIDRIDALLDHDAEGRHRVHLRVEPETNDLRNIAAGGHIWFSFIGPPPPFQIETRAWRCQTCDSVYGSLEASTSCCLCRTCDDLIGPGKERGICHPCYLSERTDEIVAKHEAWLELPTRPYTGGPIFDPMRHEYYETLDTLTDNFGDPSGMLLFETVETRVPVPDTVALLLLQVQAEWQSAFEEGHEIGDPSPATLAAHKALVDALHDDRPTVWTPIETHRIEIPS